MLTEGLKFLMNVFHLFPPIDKVRYVQMGTSCMHFSTPSIFSVSLSSLPHATRAQAAAERVQLEALKAVQVVMEDLLNSVLEKVQPAPDTVGEGESVEKERAEEGEIREQEGQATDEEVEQEEGGLGLASDVEQEMDKEARLQILLHLFRLACSMVTILKWS